jgi:hypothetical protein
MRNTQYKLNNLFEFKELSDRQVESLTENKEFKSLKNKMAKNLKGIQKNDGFVKELFSQVCDFLKIDFRTVLLSAWGKSEDFIEFFNNNDSPGEIHLIPLSDHKVVSEHNPYLETYVNNITIGKVKFNIHFEFNLKGVILKVQDQNMKNIAIDACSGKCNIMYGGSTIMAKEFQLPLPQGLIELGEGIPLKLLKKNISKINEHFTSSNFN